MIVKLHLERRLPKLSQDLLSVYKVGPLTNLGILLWLKYRSEIESRPSSWVVEDDVDVDSGIKHKEIGMF